MVFVLFLHFAVLLAALRSHCGWRLAFIYAVLAGSVELVAITELLSAMSAITPPMVAGIWLVLTALILAIFRRGGGRLEWRLPWPVLPTGWLDRLMLAAILALALASLIVALVAPPNNWDSLTYHLSRVAQWASRHGVQPYPTNIPRQLYQAPFAEFAILHLYVLAGGDRFVNLVSWFAWVATMVAASVLARDLGARRRGQIWTALLVATLPMAVLQATNAQNDLVLSFAMLAMAVFMLRIFSTKMRPAPWMDFVAVGTAMGIALLTKGNAYPFITPWLLAMVVVAICRWRAAAFGPLAACALMVIALNGGQWGRNYSVFGSPLGTTVERGTFRDNVFTNDTRSPRVLLSNVLRNLAQHLVIGSDGFSTANPVEHGVTWLHERMGIDVNAPGTTWTGERFSLSADRWNDLDYAGNPWHLLIALALAVGALSQLRWIPGTWIVLLTLGSFLLFCLLMRWQPWHPRLHTPLFLLLAAPMGRRLEKLRWRPLAGAAALVLIIGAGWRVLDNHYHPLLGERSVFRQPRIDQYIVDNPTLVEPLHTLARTLDEAGVDSIQLACNNDEPEYLLWVFGRLKYVRHVGVRNVSGRLPVEPWPCPVLIEMRLDQGKFGLQAVGSR